MLEAAERFTDVEGEPAVQQYALLVSALRSLAADEHAASSILDAFLLRSLGVAGWAPSFADCARCGEPGPHAAFSVAAGGSVCPSCRPPGSAAPSRATLDLLAALLSGDWEVADASDERQRREAAGLTAAFVQYHLERGLRSLRLVDRG
jgi:DNA repair protein RecO (recombination protein O)